MCGPEKTAEQTVDLLVIGDDMMCMWLHYYKMHVRDINDSMLKVTKIMKFHYNITPFSIYIDTFQFENI